MEHATLYRQPSQHARIYLSAREGAGYVIEASKLPKYYSRMTEGLILRKSKLFRDRQSLEGAAANFRNPCYHVTIWYKEMEIREKDTIPA